MQSGQQDAKQSSEQKTQKQAPKSKSWRGYVSIVPVAIGLVFLGCCANVIFLELLIKEDAGSGNIITFFQFLFVALEGGIFVTGCGRKPPYIPLSRYFVLVCLFFAVSVINNYALNFDIPLPLHMIFRAGSLMANMVLGIILLKKRYGVKKYVAVIMITVGITMATMASAHQINGSQEGEGEGGVVQRFTSLTIGASLLLLALFLSARMGIFQEVLYSQYGKHPREAMFYLHTLPLPGFLLLAPDIWKRTLSFTLSEPILVLGMLPVPKMWLYILGNCITQYVCIRGVFTLTTECPSLVVTLVVTLRKFASLIFSIMYFHNPFTPTHWLATALVFTGTALFADLFSSVLKSVRGKHPKAE